MVFITEDTWRKNGVEVIIVDNIKWLNETNIEEEMGNSALRNNALKNKEKKTKARINRRLVKTALQKIFKRSCRSNNNGF